MRIDFVEGALYALIVCLLGWAAFGTGLRRLMGI
jgi:hypothetical protein